MKKDFKIILVALIILIVMMVTPAFSQEDLFKYNGQTVVSMSDVPTDSAESERVRVWLPLGRQNTCRTTVTIHDHSGKKVRSFLSEMMPRGYHNLYWDKRDDSGQWVPAGEYKYKVDDCESDYEGKLTVVYGPDEKDCLIYGPTTDGVLKIGYELFRDSTNVSVNILNHRGRSIQSIFTDSVMTQGRYTFEWLPGKRIAKGIFQIEVTAGEAKHSVFVSHIKPK